MKVLLYLGIIVLLAFSVFAQLELDDVRFYVEDESISTADEDGGDIDVTPDDKFEVLMDFQNNMDNKTQVKIIGTLENIDNANDIEKDISYFDVDANDDKAKTLSYIIPSDARRGYYDFEMEYTVKYSNGTESTYSITYEVYVRDEEEQQEEIDLQYEIQCLGEQVGNLTTKLESMVEDANYYEKYTYCFSNLTRCHGDREMNEAAADELMNCDRNLDNCETAKIRTQNLLTAKESEYNSCDVERKDAESTRNLYGFIALGLAIGLIVMYITKVKGINKRDSHPTDSDSRTMEAP